VRKSFRHTSITVLGCLEELPVMLHHRHGIRNAEGDVGVNRVTSPLVTALEVEAPEMLHENPDSPEEWHQPIPHFLRVLDVPGQAGEQDLFFVGYPDDKRR
jgi:hypothetical protein